MSTHCTTTPTSLAQRVAPDDLRRGEYVAVLHEVCELPSFLWCCDSGVRAPDQVVEITYRPLPEDREPLKIVALCLPFVFVRRPNGEHRTLDIRGCSLARLDQEYAKAVWKGLKKKSEPRKTRKRRSKK